MPNNHLAQWLAHTLYSGNFFQRTMPLHKVTEKELFKATDLMNNRPRKCLGYKTPWEVFSRAMGIDHTYKSECCTYELNSPAIQSIGQNFPHPVRHAGGKAKLSDTKRLCKKPSLGRVTCGNPAGLAVLLDSCFRDCAKTQHGAVD